MVLQVEPRREYICSTGLVLHLPLYDMDGGIFKTKDSYGHQATVNGALWRLGGRYFDGVDDKIDCGNASPLDITGNITVEVWFKQETGGAVVPDLLGKATDYTGYGIETNTTNRVVHFRTGHSGTAWDTSPSYVVSPGSFYHIVGVYDGSYLRLYVNGVEITPATVFSSGLPTNAATVKLGVHYSGDPGIGAFKGDIGEARIYNRALTPLEIQQNYLRTKWRYQ